MPKALKYKHIMEKRRSDIELPAEFTCAMEQDEANRRAALAERFDGVSFCEVGKTCDGRVEGRTIVTNLKAFDKFSKQIYPS